MKTQTKKGQIKLLVGSDAIGAAIEKHLTARGKLDTELHMLACSALDHVIKHNDPTLLNRLVDGLPGSVRKNALRDWAVGFGNVVYDDTSKSICYSRGKASDIEAALAKPFWEFKVEAPFKAYDFNTELASFLARAEKASKDSRNSVSAELLLKVRDVAKANGVTLQ